MTKVDEFVKIIEKLILKEDIKAGDKLPPERELAIKYCFSRQTIHNGLIRLEEKNLVEIEPRQCVRVVDYKIKSNFRLLDTLIDMNKQEINLQLKNDMIVFLIYNIEMILKVAMKHDYSNELEKIVSNAKNEKSITIRNRLIFNYYHQLCVISNNMMFIMLINSFEVGFINASKYISLDSYAYSKLLNLFTTMNELIKEKNEKAFHVNNDIGNLIKKYWIEGDVHNG